MKFKLLFITLLVASFTYAQTPVDSERALKQVIEDFRMSIIKHDNEKKFANLFLNESVVWAAIFTGKSKEMVLKKKPDFKFQTINYKSFYKMMKDGDEERFYNIKIDSRGEFASISFDYSFQTGAKVENWGTEYWSLMLINNEWKITSVTWTMNLQQLEKCPFVSDKYFVLNK